MRRVRGIGRRFSDTVLGGLPSVRPINFELIAFANDLACIEASISLIPSHPLFPFLLKRGAATQRGYLPTNSALSPPKTFRNLLMLVAGGSEGFQDRYRPIIPRRSVRLCQLHSPPPDRMAARIRNARSFPKMRTAAFESATLTLSSAGLLR